MVRFTIRKNGRVGRVREAFVQRSTLRNFAAEQCILRIVRQMLFPAPERGTGIAVITFPFVFKSMN